MIEQLWEEFLDRAVSYTIDQEELEWVEQVWYCGAMQAMLLLLQLAEEKRGEAIEELVAETTARVAAMRRKVVAPKAKETQ